MVNNALFTTQRGRRLPTATAHNHHGAPAYAFGPKHWLAQLAATGCLNNTFYTRAADQLAAVRSLAPQVDSRFLAQLAVHARQAGHMKDMPALLAAMLAQRDVELLQRVFSLVIDNGKMLRNFVQILRSGEVGRKSLGTRPKKLVQQWLQNASEKQLLQAAIGTNPSLADLVKMVHPKPKEAWRSAWFAWLLRRPYGEAALPPLTQALERFKRQAAAGAELAPPDVPFQLLTALPLSATQWAQIARAGSWQMLRQNLNAFARHGVFAIDGMSDIVAAKLRDPAAIARARVMPYQLMMAYQASRETSPHPVQWALEDALQLALANVNAFEGRVVVCPDVSGSMLSPVTGDRGSATSQVRCVDVAALMAAAVLHHNPTARVLPFAEDVMPVTLNPRDTVMTNAQRLATLQGGGTCCSAPLARLNREQALVDLVIFVSDYESWIDARAHPGWRYQLPDTSPSAMMREWQRLKQRCPQARLVCIDITPHGTTQAVERPDILNVGGFSDSVFDLVQAFAKGRVEGASWVSEIERIELDEPH